jgi:hypothetical protein
MTVYKTPDAIDLATPTHLYWVALSHVDWAEPKVMVVRGGPDALEAVVRLVEQAAWIPPGVEYGIERVAPVGDCCATHGKLFALRPGVLHPVSDLEDEGIHVHHV